MSLPIRTITGRLPLPGLAGPALTNIGMSHGRRPPPALRPARAAERPHQPGPARRRLPGLDARQGPEPGRPPGSPRRPDRAPSGPLSRRSSQVHLEAHGGDVEKSLAAIPAGKSTRESLAGIGDPDVEATLGHVGSGLGSTDGDDADRTATYAVGAATSDGQRFRVLRPHARGGLGAVFVALDAELTARSRSSRSSTTTPTTRPAASGSCSRPRSPAGWSTPASSRSTAWAPTPTAGPTTPCGSSGRQPQGGHRAVPRRRSAEDATPAGGRWSCASCCGGSSTSATPSTTPTAAACCTATSSRATSSSASTARRWSSTGAWPRPLGKAEPPAAEERTLMPSSASGSAETLPGTRAGHAGLHEPRAGPRRPRPPRAPVATSTAWAPRSTAC